MRNTVEYRRTAVIKLDTPEGGDSLLHETVEQFKHCANTASKWCWHGDDGYHVTSKDKAEQALYDQLRDETNLTANLVQKGIRRAVEAVKSGVEASSVERTRHDHTPYFSADSAVYDKRSATFHRDHVSLSTVDGRIECDYILPDDSEKPPTKYVFDEDFEFRMAHLQYRDGDWCLHASMRKVEEKNESSESDSKHRTVLGVDLGVNNIAVASTGLFWSADESTTGATSTRNAVARSNSVGRVTPTRTSRVSVARRLGGSRHIYTRWRTNSSRRPSNTTVRTSCSRT
jgi:hypothetical protein